MKDDEILAVLRHSLGLDHEGRGREYRNHFVTGEGSTDFPICTEAVSRGLMCRRDGNALTGGHDLFAVTNAGRAFVSQHAPAPLTRSQRRYEAFLDADSSMSFGEWIRSPYGRQAA